MTSKYANYLHPVPVVSPIRSFIFDSYKPVFFLAHGPLRSFIFDSYKPVFFLAHGPLRSRFHPPAAPPPAPFASGSRANHHTSLREDSSTNAF